MSHAKEMARRLGFAQPEIKHIDLTPGLTTEFRGDTPYGPYIVKIEIVEAEDSQVRLQVSSYANHFAAKKPDSIELPGPITTPLFWGIIKENSVRPWRDRLTVKDRRL
jgi:hypothetical protein